jgi:hypothetical protein
LKSPCSPLNAGKNSPVGATRNGCAWHYGDHAEPQHDVEHDFHFYVLHLQMTRTLAASRVLAAFKLIAFARCAGLAIPSQSFARWCQHR